MATSKKSHKVRLLATTPAGRRGEVIEVKPDHPHIDRWLGNGVAEYVEEVSGGREGSDGDQDRQGGGSAAGSDDGPDGGSSGS